MSNDTSNNYTDGCCPPFNECEAIHRPAGTKGTQRHHSGRPPNEYEQHLYEYGCWLYRRECLAMGKDYTEPLLRECVLLPQYIELRNGRGRLAYYSFNLDDYITYKEREI
jgi:hypothetical protein